MESWAVGALAGALEGPVAVTRTVAVEVTEALTRTVVVVRVVALLPPF